MSSRKDLLEVTVRYKGLKQTISGPPDAVTRVYFDIIGKLIPSFDVASGLIERPNLLEIASKLKRIVSLYKDRVIVLRDDIGTRDAVLLALIGKYMSFKLNQAKKDTMTMSEIIEATGKTKRNVTSVLRQLVANNSIEKTAEDEFRITDSKVFQYTLKRLPSLRFRKMTDFTRRYSAPTEDSDFDMVGFTVGYEGRNIDELTKVLKEHGVQMLVDVRRDAYSKYNKSFNEGTLSKKLTESKIRYVHLPELGVDYVERQKLKETRDYDNYFKKYSNYIDKNPDLISLLTELSRYDTICLMCYEKDFKRCHRRVLASKLSDKGLMFVHI